MTERYRTIVADPPWDYPGGFKRSIATSRLERATSGTLVARVLPYEAMSLEDIRGLPVADMAEDNCRLFLWTTNTYLPDAFPILKAWGFRYAQTVVWHKVNCSPWPTSIAPNSAEYLIVGTKGTPERGDPWKSAVVSQSVPKSHSQKPEAFLDLIEQVSPGPYLELFARRNRLGWDTWGNQSLEHVEMVAT